MLEGDIFRIEIPFETTTQTPAEGMLTERERSLLALLEDEPKLTQKQMAEQLGCSLDNVKYHLP